VNPDFLINGCAKLFWPWHLGIEDLHRHKILHRDISSENIMVNPNGPSSPWVILNDFDLAGQEQAEDHPVSGTSTRHRTGTLPFMAIELLRKADTGHRLEHDLESLFYVAVWWAVEGTNSQRHHATAVRRMISLKKDWNKGTVKDIAATKKEFLTSPLEIELSPDFNSVWIVLMRLQYLFGRSEFLKKLQEDARMAAARGFPVSRISQHHREDADAETLPYVTLERFREALGAQNDQAV
jgi:serine/threonine protein kinase